MDLIISQAWQSSGSSGAVGPAIPVPQGMAYATVYIDHSTLATTQSFSIQTAQESSGPWFIEASTQIAAANASTRFGMHITGPIGTWVRPYLHSNSTGAYNIQLIGVG